MIQRERMTGESQRRRLGEGDRGDRGRNRERERERLQCSNDYAGAPKQGSNL